MHQSDIVNSPTSGFRGIFGYDPNKAARLSESDDIGAQGQIDHYQAHPGSIGFNPRSSLLLGVAYFNQTYSLIDLVKRATKASCQRRVLNSGEMLYEIEVDMPEFGCSIQVDPQKSFMIQSVRQRFKKLNCESMAEAIDFKEGTGGVFFPTEVSGFLMENGKKMEQRSRIIELSVNETLPQGAFDLRFPKLLRVNDAVNNKIHVWGESGPNVTFDTIQEYHRWFVARARTEVAPPTLHDDWDSPPRERAPWRNFIIIGVSASSTLGIAIVVLRLVRARMRRDASLIED